jgi:hypothetical protein
MHRLEIFTIQLHGLKMTHIFDIQIAEASKNVTLAINVSLNTKPF